MYVHLGGGCLIRATEIIGIFPVKNNTELYKGLKNKIVKDEDEAERNETEEN